MRACDTGCEWVFASDVCSECLTPAEQALWLELLQDIEECPKRFRKRAFLQAEHFVVYLEAASFRPLAFRLTENRRAKLEHDAEV